MESRNEEKEVLGMFNKLEHKAVECLEVYTLSPVTVKEYMNLQNSLEFTSYQWW